MPTINVTPDSDEELQDIADTLGKSRKVVVITGAGISTNCGIPDFRSEDGLYSLIQAQYDAALQNPPWENSNTFDIDDRPRKRAKPSYFYEVVAPDGKVVDVIHETPTSSQPAKKTEPEGRRSLRSRSTATPTSRPSTPLNAPSPKHGDAIIELSEPPSSTPDIHQSSNKSDGIHVQETSETIEPKPPSRRSSRRGRTQSDFTSVESSFVSTSSITVTEPSSTSSDQQTISTTITCSTNTITTSTSEIRHVESQTTLQRQESSSLSKSEDEDPSATQSSQSSRTLPNLKGRDLFDSMIWNDPFTTSIFYMFISSLRNKVRKDVTSTTETHNFIKVLRDGGRLVRNYTQNIDLLEERLGLCTDLSRGVGNRARFHYRTQREPRPADVGGDSPHNGGVEVVLLHGSLGQLRCGICAKLSSWDDPEREAATLSGQAPDCPQCEDHSNKRTGRGRRSLAVGRLRPDIVLYGEEHPNADLVGPLITHDLGLGPDVMLIMGTSLKVHGLKVMIKEFAKAIHTRGGKVVFINRTKPSESAWGDVIDYWVEWDCDAWVLDLKDRREDIWSPQGARMEERDSSDDAKAALPGSRSKPSRPQCIRDDKMNGAFVTFKILDTLGRFTDSEGKPASRFPYFEKPAPRVSLPAQVEPIKKPAAKARKSLPAPAKGKSTTASKKRKSCPSDLQKLQDQLAKKEEDLKKRMMEQWAEIRCRFPMLPVLPRIRDPLKEIASNNVDMSGYHFSFHGGKNQFPNVGGIGWPSEKSMLLSHPPSGAELPLHHSPKKVQAPPPAPPPRMQTFSRPTNHAYKTRSSRRISNADTIVVDNSETRPPTWSAEEDTIVVAMDENEDSKNRLPTPPESGTRTPSSQRIKRQSSISAILSDPPSDVSSDGVFYDAQEEMI